MMWSDVITLIALTPKETSTTGFEPEYDEIQRTVYGNKTGIWSSDFYAALQVGVTLNFRVTVRSADYQGERHAIFDGKRYVIIRADTSNNGEFVVLQLSDQQTRNEDRHD